MSEIADNKWEVESSKAPVGTAGGLAQMVLMGGFIALFGYIISMSVVAIVTPKKEQSLENAYKNMGAEGTPAPAK